MSFFSAFVPAIFAFVSHRCRMNLPWRQPFSPLDRLAQSWRSIVCGAMERTKWNGSCRSTNCLVISKQERRFLFGQCLSNALTRMEMVRKVYGSSTTSDSLWLSTSLPTRQANIRISRTSCNLSMASSCWSFTYCQNPRTRRAVPGYDKTTHLWH